MMQRRSFLVLILSACGRVKRPTVEDLTAHEELSMFKLGSLKGTRDGDKLDVQALFTDSSSMLTLKMRFEIGPTSQLQTGVWRWTRTGGLQTGTVAARSVTFLGGQSGPPSIGGTFDLVGEGGAALYRVRIPLDELKERLPADPDWLRRTQ